MNDDRDEPSDRAPSGKGDAGDDEGQNPGYSLFHTEERLLEDSEAMARRLEEVATGVRGLADAYRQSYNEQRRLVRLSDRVQYDLQTANRRLADQANELRSLNEALRDEIEQRKEAERALEAAKEEAESAHRAKSRFLAIMSHEVRTPVNAVTGLAHLLMKTDLGPQQRDYVARIHQSMGALSSLINDVLDFSRIESGGLELEDAEVDLDALVDNVSAVAGASAAEKGIGFDVTVADAVPRALRGDALRLGQILLNLAANAVKFTEKGGVRIEVHPAGTEADGCLWLAFAVADTGIGLTEAQKERLFVAYNQAHSGTARQHGGTGLGLAISHELASLMGGRIDVTSTPGEGSTFTLTVPLAPAAGTAAAESADGGRLDPASLVGARALVAEDEPINRAVISEVLTDAGLSVVTVEDGGPAVEAACAADDGFDVVLMDIQMPEMDGLEATRRIRETLGSAMPPVLALSGEDVAADGETGIRGHVAKPVEPESLLDTLLANVRVPRDGGAT